MTFPNLPFNSSTPVPTNNPSVDQPDITINNMSDNAIWDVDHIGYNAPNSGIHNVIRFNNQTSTPFPITNFGQLFTKTQDSDEQLFYISGNGNINQYNAGTEGSTLCFGGIIIKWGNLSAKFSTNPNQHLFPVAFPNSCFQVVVTQQNTGFFPSNNSAITSFVVDKTKFNLILGSGYTTNCAFTYIAIGK